MIVLLSLLCKQCPARRQGASRLTPTHDVTQPTKLISLVVFSFRSMTQIVSLVAPGERRSVSAKASKPKRNSAVRNKRARVAMRKPVGRSLQAVVGPEVYQTWVSMLRVLVPDGRTHRMAPLLAAMLQYAVSIAENAEDDEIDEQSLIQSLRDSTQVSDPSEVKELLHDAVSRLFQDARVEFRRVSARGQSYSIADDAYSEYVHWFDMPWE